MAILAQKACEMGQKIVPQPDPLRCGTFRTNALRQYIRGRSEMALRAAALDGAQVFGGRFAAAAVGHNVKGDLLSLVESAHSGAFDRADMDEDILVAVFRLNEAEALLAIEPLHGSLVHGKYPYVSDARVGLRTRLSRRNPAYSILDKCLKRARLSEGEAAQSIGQGSITFIWA
jgi:hypothetical protein